MIEEKSMKICKRCAISELATKIDNEVIDTYEDASQFVSDAIPNYYKDLIKYSTDKSDIEKYTELSKREFDAEEIIAAAFLKLATDKIIKPESTKMHNFDVMKEYSAYYNNLLTCYINLAIQIKKRLKNVTNEMEMSFSKKIRSLYLNDIRTLDAAIVDKDYHIQRCQWQRDAKKARQEKQNNTFAI
ncbi:MAG: hypothetical protein RR400_00835 [Clostridia bacterium]